MNIRHPVSFILLLVVMVATAALSVAWSWSHLLVLLVTLGLMAFLRYIAHHEGRHDFGKPAFWKRWF